MSYKCVQIKTFSFYTLTSFSYLTFFIFPLLISVELEFTFSTELPLRTLHLTVLLSSVTAHKPSLFLFESSEYCRTENCLSSALFTENAPLSMALRLFRVGCSMG